ncbi:MAG: DUF3768 domain-containing protein [Bacteroidota bacterium]
MSGDNSKTIAKLNDDFRASIRPGQHFYMTQGINALPAETKLEIIGLVQTFNNFTPDNDPYGEHDFGAFDAKGERIFWKIDYYDKTMQHGSEDPADPEQTTRVLTVMLANEY